MKILRGLHELRNEPPASAGVTGGDGERVELFRGQGLSVLAVSLDERAELYTFQRMPQPRKKAGDVPRMNTCAVEVGPGSLQHGSTCLVGARCPVIARRSARTVRAGSATRVNFGAQPSAPLAAVLLRSLRGSLGRNQISRKSAICALLARTVSLAGRLTSRTPSRTYTHGLEHIIGGRSYGRD